MGLFMCPEEGVSDSLAQCNTEEGAINKGQENLGTVMMLGTFQSLFQHHTSPETLPLMPLHKSFGIRCLTLSFDVQVDIVRPEVSALI